MLVLGRRANQSIVFPSCGITIRILELNGKVAKVGIDAPRSIEVMRGELVGSQSSQVSDAFSPNIYGSTGYVETSNSLEVENIVYEPVLQLSQRIAEIKIGLHAFQQLRAAGKETQADMLLSDMLSELALLDKDCMDQAPASRAKSTSYPSTISEPFRSYDLNRIGPSRRSPVTILIVDTSSSSGMFETTACTFHGCQICSVNSLESARQSIAAGEGFDYIVCNSDEEEFGDLDLARTIRADSRYQDTRIFVTTRSLGVLASLNEANTIGIDGWLAKPLNANDLWSHIVESNSIDP
jgi:carbon storage regulator CsrA